MPAPKQEGQERFEMVKKRHFGTFETAVQDQKADAKIIPLCRFINSQAEFFTASSCSGRIVVLELDSKETKKEAAFFFKQHSKVKTETVWKRIHEKSRDWLWFKQEPFILHVGTDSLPNAERILDCCRKAGIKRAGIMVTKPGKFVVELIGTHGLSVPIKQNSRVLVDKKYFGLLVQQANKKLAFNFERLKKFEAAIRKKLGKK